MTVTALAIALSTVLTSAADYLIVDLGPGAANAINNSNQVVGTSTSLPTLWNYDGVNVTKVTLPLIYSGGYSPSGSAAGINDHGTVVGTSSAIVYSYIDEMCMEYNLVGSHAFAWNPSTPNGTNGTTIDLTPEVSSLTGNVAPDNTDYYLTSAFAVNNSGTVVGDFWYFALFNHGFTCSTNGAGIQSWIPYFTAIDNEESYPKAINASGTIVGAATGDDPDAPDMYAANGFTQFERAFALGSTLTNLLCFQGTPTAWTNSSQAWAINTSGQIAGISHNDDNTAWIACFWTNGSPSSIVALGPSGLFSYATGINDSGTVIGFETIAGAFIYDGTNGYRLLSTLVPANSGWFLNSVSGINSAGYISGTGTTNGQQHAFLLVPQP